jgi:hypothetical protein
MRSIALLALVVSASSFAGEYVSKKVSFSVGGMGGFNTTYYNCDSVEDRVESHLETLGASNISVRCSGGLDTWSSMPPMPAYVTASFDAQLPSNGGGVEEMTLKARFDQDCELNTKALQAILPEMPGVTIVSKRDSCFDNRSRWFYEITIAR